MIDLALKGRAASKAPRRTFLIEPFDIGMHSTTAGVTALQMRFANWLRSVSVPARFICWVMPATLDDKISQLSFTAREVGHTDPVRAQLLMEYRRHYEMLQESADYQRSVCGLALWSED